MRQRTRATPIQRQTSPLSIGVQLRRLPARAAAGSAPGTDDSEPTEFEPSLAVGTLNPPQGGMTCTYLLVVLSVQPALSVQWGAVWDNMNDPASPDGLFGVGSGPAIIFNALGPGMTGLQFYATLDDGTVIESGPIVACDEP